MARISRAEFLNLTKVFCLGAAGLLIPSCAPSQGSVPEIEVATSLPPTLVPPKNTATAVIPRESTPTAPAATNRWNNLETSEPPFATPDGPIVSESGLILDDRTVIALTAAEAAVRSMPGPYSWDEYRTCSTFISSYLGEFGFPISDRNGKSADSPDPFPWSGTLSQVEWLERNSPDDVHKPDLIDFLQGRLWDQLSPGVVIYLTTALGHNGFDTYYHVAALVGYHVDGEPQFAEMARGMRNPSAERTFSQLAKLYGRKEDGSWDVTPTYSDPLKVAWFDPFAVIRDII